MTERPALLDLNVLMALAWPQHIHHGRARRWFSALNGRSWATTPITEAGFVRLSINPSVVGMVVTVTHALNVVRRIGELPGHRFLSDSARLSEAGFDLGRPAAAKQVTDFHLLAVAQVSGSVLATMNRAVFHYLAEHEKDLVELIT